MDAAQERSRAPRVKRRIKLIRPAMQLRMTAVFGGLLLISLLGSSMLTAAVLMRIAGELPSDSGLLVDLLPTAIVRTFLLSVFLLIPALLVIGVRATFKVAGPVHRLEMHLAAVAAGLRPRPCTLRDGDELQELCDLVNEALATARREGEVDPEGARELPNLKLAA